MEGYVTFFPKLFKLEYVASPLGLISLLDYIYGINKSTRKYFSALLPVYTEKVLDIA